MGSSMVTTWQARFLVIRWISAARVVDFPEPVGPVIRTSPLGKALQDVGEVELRDSLDVERNPSEDAGHRTPLLVEVAAEPRDSGKTITDVYGLVVFEPLELGRREDAHQHLANGFRFQWCGLERDEPASDPQ